MESFLTQAVIWASGHFFVGAMVLYWDAPRRRHWLRCGGVVVLVVTKSAERPKYYAKKVVELIQLEGYKEFNIRTNTELWKRLEGKNEAKGFGVFIGPPWFWYDSWLDVVRAEFAKMRSESKVT